MIQQMEGVLIRAIMDGAKFVHQNPDSDRGAVALWARERAKDILSRLEFSVDEREEEGE